VFILPLNRGTVWEVRLVRSHSLWLCIKERETPLVGRIRRCKRVHYGELSFLFQQQNNSPHLADVGSRASLILSRSTLLLPLERLAAAVAAYPVSKSSICKHEKKT
jgi:hypothetical protein